MTVDLRLYAKGTTGGTPTRGAVGYRLLDRDGEVLLEHAERIGDATSHEADFRALIVGLSACQKYVRKRIHCFTDNEMVVRQLRGEYPASDPRLKQLAERVTRLAERFAHVEFGHVPHADREMALTGRLAAAALEAPDG